MKSLLFATLLALPCSLFATSQYAWLEYGPNGPIARVILPGNASCPNIVIDGKSQAMNLRAPSNGNDYNVTSCEIAIPSGTTSASINSQSLPVAKLGDATKIAIIGDTGCRLKVGDKPQDCNDPNAWPFATNTASIATWNPDLVIQVGDYYYREAKEDKSGNLVKAGYNWSRWEADFFSPANVLLQNAPWIFVRGNHEECDRAAAGWFRFLDPGTYSWEGKQQCVSNLDYTPPYIVTIGSQAFAVMDSSQADDTNVDSGQVTIFQNQLGLIQTMLTNANQTNAWLLLHHPFWVLYGSSTGTPTMYTAWANADPQPSAVGLVVAGHKHLLETLDFSDNGVAQLVIGNGGTSLTGSPKDDNDGPINGRDVRNKYVRDNWGFMAATATTTAGNWTMQVMSEKGNLKATCTVTPSQCSCQ